MEHALKPDSGNHSEFGMSCRDTPRQNISPGVPGCIYSGVYRQLEIFLKCKCGAANGELFLKEKSSSPRPVQSAESGKNIREIPDSLTDRHGKDARAGNIRRGSVRTASEAPASKTSAQITFDDSWLRCPAGQHQFVLTRISLEPETFYEVRLSDCEVGIAYLSEAEDILDRGVRFLEYCDGFWRETSNIAAWYDTPYREQYHFNAYRNWINDPNGLCYYKGYYHLYYQANPHRQEWGHMYWGHAASLDLVHWVHLPYALEPQAEILESTDKKGGAFSGCAVPGEDKITFFLTRHLGPPEDTESETVQYQTMTVSADSIHFEPETHIIDKPNAGFSFNFRDPKVWFEDGQWQMVIAAKEDEVPSIVRYTSADMLSWTFSGKLLSERADSLYAIECPDFFPLGGSYVAVDGWMMYTDKHQRYQPTYYYVGEWTNGRFTPAGKELYDFGCNFYAVQSFEHDGRRIAIGWTSDCYHEHIPEENGSIGAMTIPRELSLRNGILFQKPVAEIYSLLDRCLCLAEGQNLTVHYLNRGCWYGKLTFTEETDFDLLLGRTENGNIRLLRRGKELEIITEGVASEYVRFLTRVDTLTKVEIFSDRRLFEIYVNDGERVGTKLFYQDGSRSIFRAEFAHPQYVSKIEIWGMKSIWD